MYMCVHKIINMYIPCIYMVQTCMNRFAYLRGGGRIPDGTYRYRISIMVQTGTYSYVLSTYQNNSCTMLDTISLMGSDLVLEHHSIHATHTQYCFPQANYLKQHPLQYIVNTVHTGMYQVRTKKK